MTDDIEKDEERLLTAEYVLGLLTDQEAKAYEEVLAVDPELRLEYAFWAERIAALTDDIAPVDPPAKMLARIRSDLFGTDAVETTATKARSWLDRLGLLPAMTGGVVAALAVLWVINLYIPAAPLVSDPPVLSAPTLQAQIAAEDDSLIVLASYDATAQTLTVQRTAGQAPDGRVLELWLIADDNPPVSLGVLPDDETGQIGIDATLIPALPGGVLAISDEPPGGSTTGAPTGSVLAVGPITEA
ncbi:anti-sigma factor [Loktanella sp. TSTF-M6]|uniref:Anti-sigma factor n=1 Tax=Loktanella gaetbuli TaxID=2881335 RepID=A0ABS8BPJ5_9RHOB|nr:anti-sigma factor [Loktanella gaetbuli]MCB5197650.1 anti-sigma factor [Loktanella gaetbuli]